MMYAKVEFAKVVMTIKGKSFETIMKDIGYLLAKYPFKENDSFKFTIIPNDVGEFILKEANKKVKQSKLNERRKNGSVRSIGN